MYLVTIDNNLLHDPRIKDYQILNPVLNLEVNKTHSFNFTIYPNNPMFNSIERLKSIIEVYDDGELIFRGRPLNDTADFNKATTIQCEGELAYLNDSTMEPYSYFGSLRGLLELYINNHNAQVDASKQFTLGTVNVVGDFVRSNIEYTNTWNELSTKTFGSGMGGYLRLRRENGVNYIDYLNDSTYISGQTIELSKNLLDYEKTVKASDIVTVLIPLGAKLKDEEGNELDERLTIESVNAGSKFIENTNGIAKYGRIVGYKIWDDINSPALLKTRATNDLNFLVNLGISMKIKAIDLSMVKEPELWGRNYLLNSGVRVDFEEQDVVPTTVVEYLPTEGGRNLIPNSGVTKQFTEQAPKPQINSDFDLEQVLTLKCYFKIQLGDLI